jgi:hypothetical protein
MASCRVGQSNSGGISNGPNTVSSNAPAASSIAVTAPP